MIMEWTDKILEDTFDYEKHTFIDIDNVERPITMLKELHKGDVIFVNGRAVDILDNQEITFDGKKYFGFDSSDGEQIEFDIRDIENYLSRSDLYIFDVSFKRRDSNVYQSNYYIAASDEAITTYFKNNISDFDVIGIESSSSIRYTLDNNKRGKPVVNISYEDNTKQGVDKEGDRYPELITSAIDYLEELAKGVSKDYLVSEETDSVEKFLLTTGVISPIINDLKKLKEDYQKQFCNSVSVEQKQALLKKAKKNNKTR